MFELLTNYCWPAAGCFLLQTTADSSYLLPSAMEKYDVIPIKFNEQNYMSWSFHLKNFVEGQGLFGYLDGSITKPQPTSTTDSKNLATWSKENARVITWILNSIDPSLVVALHAYTAATDMWAHL